MMFFCFGQNTADEMRIIYWSSDVCSSDLNGSEDFCLRGGIAVGRQVEQRRLEVVTTRQMRGTFAAGGDTAAVLDGERDEVFAACALRGRDYRPHLRVGSVCRADANAAEDLGDLLDEFRLALIRHEDTGAERSEEHTSELQSLMRISYAGFFW